MWFKGDQLFVVEERCLMTQKHLRGRRGGECLMTQKHLRGRRGGALLNDTKTAERETNLLLIVTFAFSLQENHGLYEIC